MKLHSSSSAVSSWSALLLFPLGFVVASAQPAQGNRPFGGGNFGSLPGFPGLLQPDFISKKTCDARWECPLSLHGNEEDGDANDNDNTDLMGIFVCRQTYHPIFGTLQTRAKCISMDQAYETDECGCCGDDDCPAPIPRFQNISCDATSATTTTPPDDGLIGDEEGSVFTTTAKNDDDDPQDRRGLRGLTAAERNDLPANAVMVCRRHYNPYTGIPECMSMYIDPSKSIEGADFCGCCDGICPDDLDTATPFFPRPDHVELTWCEAKEDSGRCTLPPSTSNSNGGDDAETTEGVFVCRTMANMLTGVAESQALCIPPDRAWETDQCGCCGEECPEQPIPVDLECKINGNGVPLETITQECPFENGDTGIFACRSLFHPLDGSAIQRTLCLKGNEDDGGETGWATDQCGCCGSSCPDPPQRGFPTVDKQMMESSLEEDGLNSDFRCGLRYWVGIIDVGCHCNGIVSEFQSFSRQQHHTLQVLITTGI
ncbi:unnamed protein product [Cylindrotheca closterium]|uniref:Uncharacterized protein n=1 Tax=Cylindrotheca closterium TaxID=2856 RepID=A0AAD2FPN5_9STRA|nr:unnamed protein product [Cylindrotheca closterium]